MELTRINAKDELIKFREKYGITQEKLSEKTGISIPTIIGIEDGKKKPHALTVYKLNQYILKFNNKY